MRVNMGMRALAPELRCCNPAGPDWDAAMQAARSPPVAAAAASAAKQQHSESMLAQLELLQLLVQQSGAWQAIQLLRRRAALCSSQSHVQALRLPLSGSLSSETTHTACRIADDASSQCGGSRHRHKRARRSIDEEEVSSGEAARAHAAGQGAGPQEE